MWRALNVACLQTVFFCLILAPPTNRLWGTSTRLRRYVDYFIILTLRAVVCRFSGQKQLHKQRAHAHSRTQAQHGHEAHIWIQAHTQTHRVR